PWTGGAPAYPRPGTPAWAPPVHGSERLARFTALLEAAHAEVYQASATDWPARLAELLEQKAVARLLYAPTTPAGRQLAQAWGEATDGRPRLIAYDRPVEAMKETLVSGVEAALTGTLGGIAHTGSLVLWPTPDEPRLMSLLPPLHIALVEETAIADSLSALIASQHWAKAMPTNALLISGPSKTADIEQTLAYGVHGPKALIVLVIRP
ncbi:lactate utilization protein, partial [Rhodospirillum rubrum]|nr:lactate utilization protein [Rhodospirillum rubrum]